MSISRRDGEKEEKNAKNRDEVVSTYRALASIAFKRCHLNFHLYKVFREIASFPSVLCTSVLPFKYH